MFSTLTEHASTKKQNPTTLKSAYRKLLMQEANNPKPQYAQAGKQCKESTKENTVCLVVDIGKLMYIISELKRSKSSVPKIASHPII